MPKEKHWTSQFPYLTEAEYPLLFVGLVVGQESDLQIGFREPWQPVRIEHTTAGVGCHIYYLYGLFLAPGPEVWQNMLRLDKQWLGSNLGSYRLRPDEILSYRKDVRTWFKLDCLQEQDYLNEALYPLDMDSGHSGKSLSKLTATVLPDKLTELLRLPRTRRERELFSGLRWHLFILGRNSD